MMSLPALQSVRTQRRTPDGAESPSRAATRGPAPMSLPSRCADHDCPRGVSLNPRDRYPRALVNRTSVEGPYVLVRADASTGTGGQPIEVNTTVQQLIKIDRVVRQPGAVVFPGIAMPGRSHRSFSPPAVIDIVVDHGSSGSTSVPPRKRCVRCSSLRNAQRD